ncbi:MAG TPA: acVLRF1 family peptidyl-tRNA hydrolase [Nocardioides sp.]
MDSRALLLPPARLARWVENFDAGHGGCEVAVAGGALSGTGGDGSTFAARLPFGRSCGEATDVEGFIAACAPPSPWGILLVRKGGFAVARLEADRITDSKVGQRHVQGRTKAGGQSQQRFARRRGNQAREAYAAAAGHAARILDAEMVLVTGGDRDAIAAVLDHTRLRPLVKWVVEPFLAVPDPRRSVLESAIADAMSVRMSVTNT